MGAGEKTIKKRQLSENGDRVWREFKGEILRFSEIMEQITAMFLYDNQGWGNCQGEEKLK